jgi:thioredoxin-related protein
MLTRRTLMTAGAGVALATGACALAAQPARAAAVMTDDGFYREDWFIDSFLELGDDRASAAAAGRQLAVMWEKRGCPYCRETHLVNFADKAIEAYVRSHFDVLELNFHGSRIVTDFDGEKLEERRLAIKYGIRGTPTIQFFPNRDDLGSKAPRDREVHRIQGYMPPNPFLVMFSFVGERAYERGTLRDYLRQQG